MNEKDLSPTDRPARDGSPTKDEITELLIALRGGERQAMDRLLERLYPKLRALAHRQLYGQPPELTLDTTALVHEAYLKLVHAGKVEWNDRAHFLAVAVRAMRQILVSHWRQRLAIKRGGGLIRVTFADAEQPRAARTVEILALDQALTRLEEIDERLAKVVELTFFGGLSNREIGAVLGVTDRTVKRLWRTARAYLHETLKRQAPEPR